jgi:glycine/D-amino acid oxidase-like deaminating enzyme
MTNEESIRTGLSQRGKQLTTIDPLGYSATSFWLETCDDDLTPRPSLEGSAKVDVAILGAGFTGLWTAYELLRREPTLKVTILEKEIAGFGASGRNGGWCAAGLQASPVLIERRFGREAMMALEDAIDGAVDEIERVCTSEGIDADYVKGGSLVVARGPNQLPQLEAHWASLVASGRAEHYERLDATGVAHRIRVNGALGGIFGAQYASIQPAKLVRALARAVERRGGTIHERTEVVAVEPGAGFGKPRPALTTASGKLHAETVVLAGEAYLTQFRPWHRALLPVYSLIVLTEPLSEDQWNTIGWQDRECLSSYRLTIDYLSRTSDGRILFGGRGAPYHFGSRVEPAFDRDERTHTMLRRLVNEWFPSIPGIAFTHAWGGPLGFPRDWLPTFSYDRQTGIASARGYTGHGVATSNLAGRVLADLITDARTPLTELPLVNHRSPNWEPEPFRWLGVRYVQESLLRLDAKADRTGRPPNGKSLAERLAFH